MIPIDLENWPRRKAFEHFKDYDQPFFNITANLDVTELYDFCKANGLSFSLACLFYSTETANEIREFRTRMVDGRPVEFARIEPSQTIANDDETFSFCHFELRSNVFEFDSAGREATEKCRREGNFDTTGDRVDLLYYSVIPWISFTSFKNAMNRDVTETVPRLVFGKMFTTGDRRMIPHSVEVHHAVCDGAHVGKYFNALQEQFSAPR